MYYLTDKIMLVMELKWKEPLQLKKLLLTLSPTTTQAKRASKRRHKRNLFSALFSAAGPEPLDSAVVRIGFSRYSLLNFLTLGSKNWGVNRYYIILKLRKLQSKWSSKVVLLLVKMVFCYQNCSDLLWEKCSSDRDSFFKGGQKFAN